ncbi:RNA/RNP complex-1-interacting phosphatase [Pseudorasbora parva]|uniref:RNA/RNP complex-1-interacting phosphatase n=1 Tax=Pseudorasbora parva TaxID=51549 RepID=UPI00351F5A4F
MHSKKKNGIPDRWTDYSALGKRIPGTRFIAFKVPLKQALSYRLTQSEAFGPFDLVRMLEKEGQELGLIIDLTFTTRYYKVEDLPNTLYHLKIFTAGHEVPNDATILSFKKAVRHFLHDNENNDKLIGVHCTHGLNRTGYLICRYLIDVDGMKPQKAINLFNASRGHSIERENYLDDLTKGPKRSNVGMEEPDQEPSRGRANETRHEAPHHRREQYNHNPPFNGQESHQGHRNSQHLYFNVEEPDQEPSWGHGNETRHDPPHHRSEQHNRDPPFNGRGSHQGHREPQHPFFPFHQRNNVTTFRPPEPQSFHPPPFPHPPQGMGPARPSFPNRSARGFYFSPSASYQPPHREPRHHPYAHPERSTRAPEHHRKPQHIHRKRTER